MRWNLQTALRNNRSGAVKAIRGSHMRRNVSSRAAIYAARAHHETSLQAETLCCLGRVARPCGVDRRSTFRLMCEPRIALTAPHISRSAPMIRRFIDAARVGRAAYDITSPRTGSSSLPCLRRPHELQVSTMPWRRSFCGLAGPVLFRARLRYGLQRRANNRQIVVRTLPLTTKSTVSA